MQAFPFTSQVTYDEEGNPEYDRAVDADILRNLFKNYYSNGVFPNPSTNFQVVADEGMQVVVNPGACLIEGATGYETEKRTLVVQAAESTDRIDCVVLRLNDNIYFRNIDLYVVKGNSATEPPKLTRTGGVYEIGLANLYVSANSSTITTERITDTRMVTERCGYAMPVQEFDTTALFDQLKAQVDANIELIQRAIDGTESQHLQSQIDVLSSDMTEANSAIEKHEHDISELNNSLIKECSIGTPTDSIGNSNSYTAPCDGYVWFRCDWIANAYCTIKIDDLLVTSVKGTGNSGAGEHCSAIFVKKGMTFKVVASTYGYAKFYPIE